MSELVTRLQNIVGENRVLDDEDARTTYGQDWTRFFSPNPLAVVFPSSTEQVKELVLLAREEKIALVPSGDRTGSSSGAVAENGELIVSFDRMNKVDGFDPVDQTVSVGAVVP